MLIARLKIATIRFTHSAIAIRTVVNYICSIIRATGTVDVVGKWPGLLLAAPLIVRICMGLGHLARLTGGKAGDILHHHCRPAAHLRLFILHILLATHLGVLIGICCRLLFQVRIARYGTILQGGCHIVAAAVAVAVGAAAAAARGQLAAVPDQQFDQNSICPAVARMVLAIRTANAQTRFLAIILQK